MKQKIENIIETAMKGSIQKTFGSPSSFLLQKIIKIKNNKNDVHIWWRSYECIAYKWK